MLALMLGLMNAAAAPQPATAKVVCEVGRAALRDTWPARVADAAKRDTTNYVDVEHRLFAACPMLRAEVPAGYTIADADAWARASVHVPVQGRQVDPAFIAWIDVPNVAADGKSATVQVGYDCTGLCGGGALFRYVRTPQGWRRDGQPLSQWVS
ncbi:MAG: hypothetical protein J0I47_08130 [Sphingomonas sp.]|uniref:hypothetical protein n=1 Tax=Sphingomonas sp. TaxID=28214 RepID=UPI001AD4C216|nr:hypothetical protein [Sphingomonas sp.]MBN8808190.1 hypothetical protein [Sphingomonas sp.]